MGKFGAVLAIALIVAIASGCIQQAPPAETPEQGGKECAPKYLDNYRCDGNTLGREYVEADCNKHWVAGEVCEFGCSKGACLSDPCKGVECKNYCEGNTIHSQGVCENGACKYSEEACKFGCSGNACATDPCSGLKCENYCDANTRYYGGSCSGGECKYKTEQCGYKCESGACVADACAGKACADYCDGGRRYYNGNCSAGECSYSSMQCAYGCKDGNCSQDACIGVNCNPYCDGSYWLYAEGSCNDGACNYVKEYCAYGCENGACKSAPAYQGNPNQNPKLVVAYPVNLELYVVGDIYSGNCAPLGDDSCCPVGSMKFKNNSNFKGVKTTDPNLNSYGQKMYFKLGFSAQEVQELKSQMEQMKAALSGHGINLDISYMEISGTTNMLKMGCGIMPHPNAMSELIGPGLNTGEDFVDFIHDSKDNITNTYLPFLFAGLSFGPDAGIRGSGYIMTHEMAMGFSYHELAHLYDLAMKAPSGVSNIPDIYGNFTCNGLNCAYSRYYPSCGQADSNKLKWFPGADDCTTDPDYYACGLGSCPSATAFVDHIFSVHYSTGYKFIGNHCRDGKKDYGETGIDCGGTHCNAC